jgi:serine/threonine-protein kinase
LELKDRNDEAIAEYQKAIALDDDPLPRALLGRLYAKVGRKGEAREILQQLQESAKHRYVSPYLFGIIHLGLGELDQAMDFLEKTYEDRDGYNIAFVKVDSFLDPLRGDSRFEAFVERLFSPK